MSSSRAVNEYEVLYGVGLLDDIHNYFPALLYDTGAFLTVPEVLSYVQQQTRRRFDLFSMGRNAYIRRQIPVYTGAPYIFSSRGVAASGAANTTPRATVTTPESLLGLFTSILNPNFMANHMSNVIIRPSPEVIAANTQVSEVTSQTDDNCAICQDGFEVGNQRRSLNVCHHSFHAECIDTWFQENVHCPVCRHDIREATLTPVPVNSNTSGGETSSNGSRRSTSWAR
jgi:hypothetical protein